MRINFETGADADLAELDDGFAQVAARFDMTHEFHEETARVKDIIIMSHFDHCQNDLPYRWRISPLPVDIVEVISNRRDYQKAVVHYDILFHCTSAAPAALFRHVA